MALEIRIAKGGDATAIAHVHVESWRAAYQGLMPSEFLASLSVEDRIVFWERCLLDTPPTTFVALDRGNVVGWASCGPSRDDDGAGTGELMAINIRPSHWRSGVGRQLFNVVKKELAAFPILTLWVVQGNARAIQFYSAMGCHPDGATKSIRIANFEVSELRMRRRTT